MNAEWTLSFPSGRMQFVCGAHLRAHNDDQFATPAHCVELANQPWHPAPECDVCKATAPSEGTDLGK